MSKKLSIDKISQIINFQRRYRFLRSEINKINDEGLKSLLNTLKDHPRIESLFIANNQFNSISINYLIDFIIKNKTIKRIDITDNFIEKTEKLNQLKKIAATNNIRLIT